jgi:hypothetical protein
LGEIPAVICASDESGAIGGSLNGVWCQDSEGAEASCAAWQGQSSEIRELADGLLDK